MKKVYMAPQTEQIEVKIESALLDGSITEVGGDTGIGQGGNESGTGNPDSRGFDFFDDED